MSFTNRIRKLFDEQNKPKKPKTKKATTAITPMQVGEYGPEGGEPHRSFSLAEVLTVTTGVLLVSQSDFKRIQTLINYLLVDSAIREPQSDEQALEQLGEGANRCVPWIFEQVEWMKKVGPVPEVAAVTEWLAKLGRKHGETIILSPMPISKVGWQAPADIFWNGKSNDKVKQ